MGVVLVIAGLLLWLLAGYFVIGVIVLIAGLVLLFVPGPFYGYSYWNDRRPPP
jgi:4-amino-4-deoxy-L-arabinose transferase-like glycosyltransferase